MKITNFRIYYTKYQLFKDDYVVNIANINQKNDERILWLSENMNYMIYIPDQYLTYGAYYNAYDIVMHYKQFGLTEDDYITINDYSKVIDLTQVSDKPYITTFEILEEENFKLTQYNSFDQFGYNENNVDQLLNKYDIILEDFFPCPFILSVKKHTTMDPIVFCNEVVYLLNKHNDELYTPQSFIDYVNSGKQYFIGQAIATVKDFRRVYDFSFWLLDEILKNKNDDFFPQLCGYRKKAMIMESIVGYAWTRFISTKNNPGFAKMKFDFTISTGKRGNKF